MLRCCCARVGGDQGWQVGRTIAETACCLGDIEPEDCICRTTRPVCCDPSGSCPDSHVRNCQSDFSSASSGRCSTAETILASQDRCCDQPWTRAAECPRQSSQDLLQHHPASPLRNGTAVASVWHSSTDAFKPWRAQLATHCTCCSFLTASCTPWKCNG